MRATAVDPPWLFFFLETTGMRVVCAAAVAVMMNASLAWAQAPITPGQPPPQVVPPAESPLTPGQEPQPGQVPPGAPAPTAPAPVPGVVVAPVAPLTRTFTAKSGLLFNTVRPERVKDFETVMWYLQQALQKTTDPALQAQAAGWRIYKATEPGPNATILYVFQLEPAVPGADYSLGRILAEAYPDQITQIWTMYQQSVTGGGTLLNLTPVDPMPPLPATAAPTAEPATPPARTPPPAPPTTGAPTRTVP
jgi:hypothetical protein